MSDTKPFRSTNRQEFPWDRQKEKEISMDQPPTPTAPTSWEKSEQCSNLHNHCNHENHKESTRKIRIKARQSYAELSLSYTTALQLRDDDRSLSFRHPIEIPWYPRRNHPVHSRNSEIYTPNVQESRVSHANHKNSCSMLESSSYAKSKSTQVGESELTKMGERTFSCPSDESSSSTVDKNAILQSGMSASAEFFSEKWYDLVNQLRQNKYWRHLERQYQQKYQQFWVVALVLLFMVVILSVGSSQPAQLSKSNITDYRGPFYPDGDGKTLQPASFPLHINCGAYDKGDGSNYFFTDRFDIVWVPDDFFLSGASEDRFGSVYQSMSCDTSMSKAVNFLEDEILCSGRQFKQAGNYKIPIVAAAAYAISLYFYVDGESDWWLGVFDIKIQGKTIFHHINPFNKTGGKSNQMFRLVTVQELNSTEINIEITPIIGSAVISGLRILQAKPTSTTKNSLTPLPPSVYPKTTKEPSPSSSLPSTQSPTMISALPPSQTPSPMTFISRTQQPSSSLPLPSSEEPSTMPFLPPTQVPLVPNTAFPTTKMPNMISLAPTPNSVLIQDVTYIPGNLTVNENGLILSEGLTAKIIGNAGQLMTYANGQKSEIPFHIQPDAGDCFVDPRPWNVGGWIYVSNSEAPKVEDGDEFPGGVGALTFNKDGQLIDYRMILEDTRMNCGGGTTPWGAWISGEEYGNSPNATNTGKVWQTDPTGERRAQRITLGESYSGMFESFAYDIRDTDRPRFFMTRDHDKVGDVRRWTPDSVDWDDPWNILLGKGTLEFLVVEPNPSNSDVGTFYWTADWNVASENHKNNFPNTEGIDVVGDTLYFVSKKSENLFVLNLDDGTYIVMSTKSGLFQGQPDQLVRLFDQERNPTTENSVLYITEDGGKYAGVHGRNSKGDFLTILESHEYSDETTGLAFSPDAKHMYVAYQDNGLLFDVSRVDGYPFNGVTHNLKYHSATGNSS